jgi:hypothetical protein
MFRIACKATLQAVKVLSLAVALAFELARRTFVRDPAIKKIQLIDAVFPVPLETGCALVVDRTPVIAWSSEDGMSAVPRTNRV